jgi:hypothetical protein
MCVPKEPSYFLLESIPVYLEKCNIFKLLTLERGTMCWGHRLNMELDLQSLFGLHVHSCSSPLIWAHKRGRFWSAKIDDISL